MTDRISMGTSAGLPPDLTAWQMFQDAGWVVQAVMILLAAASVGAWTVLVAKRWELARLRRGLLQASESLSGMARLADARCGNTPGGQVAGALVEAARIEWQLSGAGCEKAGLKERVASRLQRIELAQARRLRSGLGLLASIGAVAPFVGLFGTVWGIMDSFIGIARANTTQLAVVAPGIAEALLATAMGLAAAIPAVLIYNLLMRQIASLRGLIGDLSAHVQQCVSRELDRPDAARPVVAVVR